MSPLHKIPFFDLHAQRQRLQPGLDQRIKGVLEHGAFIMGPEVAELELALAAYCGAQHCITCANGTDAITLVLMAHGIGPGDAVIVPAFTFAATAEAVAILGATPIFCDVDAESFNLSPTSLIEALALAKTHALTPRAVIPADLFGQPANYPEIEEIAHGANIVVIADAAQSFGATRDGRAVGTLAEITTTSFFPAKPFGCYGDGGAIFCDDEDIAMRLRSLRVHGKGTQKYDNVRVGMNSRLDTLQAAVLLSKLEVFGEEIVARNAIAECYTATLKANYQVPTVAANVGSVWAQYTLILDGPREPLVESLKKAGVPTAVYYPIPLSRQSAYAQFPSTVIDVSAYLSEHVLSLPMGPYLSQGHQDWVIEVLLQAE